MKHNKKNVGQYQQTERNVVAVWYMLVIIFFYKWLMDIWGSINNYVTLTDQTPGGRWIFYTEFLCIDNHKSRSTTWIEPNWTKFTYCKPFINQI